jgi:hypothetical protein
MKTKEWTKEEIDFLKNNYLHKSTKYCSEHLGRTKSAIRKRLKILGLECQKIKESKEIYKKENIEPIILSSKNFKEIIIKLGKTFTGSNHETIKKYIKLYNIDISHFETRFDIANRTNRKIVAIENMLVENCSFSRKAVKNRLYKTGLKTRCCELCGQGEEWNGKKMSLILDHINGVNNDNRIENLQIVCPNCNATLDTHCGKHNKKENLCLDCKIVISSKATKCQSCARKNEKVLKSLFNRRKVKIRPPYEELIVDIESLGYCGTGRKFGVTDNAIRKWEKSYLKQKEN